MKPRFLGIVLLALMAPLVSFAQLDGTAVGGGASSVTPDQLAFVKSCKGNTNENRLLLSALDAMNRHDRSQANLYLKEFSEVAAPGGKWKQGRLRRCYNRVLTQVEGADTRGKNRKGQ